MLRSIVPPQTKNISERYKVMCGCEYCIFYKSIYSSLLSWCDGCLNNIKYLSQNYQNQSSGEMDNRLFDTYKNSVILHGSHIYET